MRSGTLLRRAIKQAEKPPAIPATRPVSISVATGEFPVTGHTGDAGPTPSIPIRDRPAARHRAPPRPALARALPTDRRDDDPGLRPRGFVVAAVLVGLGVLTFCVLSTSGLLSEDASVVLDNAGQFFGGAAAAIASFWSWHRSRSPDRAWRLLLGLGTLGWTCGLVAWAWFQIVVGHELPSPSVADIGFFTLPLFALPALYLFPARQRVDDAGRAEQRPYARLVFVLDSLVVVGSLFVLTWSTALGAAVRTGTQDRPMLLIALGYPITDLLMVVFVVLLGTFRAPRNALALLLLGLGLVGVSVSDSLYLYLVSIGAGSMPPLYNIGFVAGPALLALSALAPNVRQRAAQPSTEHPGGERGAVLLPYIPLTATGLMLIVQLATQRSIDLVEGVLGLALVGLVVGRQLITLMDNVNLLRQVREGQDRLRRQAYHDSLTGLSNRAMFGDELERAVRAHREHRRPLALLYCDLDDFKFVNDRYGHAAGDELLRAVAGRLNGALRRPGTIARLGGDEFAVLLEGRVDTADAVAQRVLEALVEPYELNVTDVAEVTDDDAATPLTLRAGASMGLVLLDADEPPASPDTLLARVDAAMYAAKRRGKNRLVVFRSELFRQQEEPTLLGELRRAIAAGNREAGRDVLEIVDDGTPATDPGRIAVMYQPVVRLGATAQVVAVEALVRWRHPRHGLLSADMLVSAADDADLLDELEEHVLDLACRDIKQLRTRAALRDLAVHVNLSANRAGDTQLVRTVREALVRHSLPGQALVLEITETARVPDLDTAAWVLRQIRRLDVRLALDDFGTGFSGLSYLLELPIDIVKLDRSLTVADADSRGGTIRNAAAALTVGLGLDLIAEGVETTRQAEEVTGLGCQFGQGYLWSRPAFLADLDLSGTLPQN